jgi:hypothetical protein
VPFVAQQLGCDRAGFRWRRNYFQFCELAEEGKRWRLRGALSGLSSSREFVCGLLLQRTSLLPTRPGGQGTRCLLLRLCRSAGVAIRPELPAKVAGPRLSSEVRWRFRCWLGVAPPQEGPESGPSDATASQRHLETFRWCFYRWLVDRSAAGRPISESLSLRTPGPAVRERSSVERLPSLGQSARPTGRAPKKAIPGKRVSEFAETGRGSAGGGGNSVLAALRKRKAAAPHQAPKAGSATPELPSGA